jgi:hypothetical protein
MSQLPPVKEVSNPQGLFYLYVIYDGSCMCHHYDDSNVCIYVYVHVYVYMALHVC